MCNLSNKIVHIRISTAIFASRHVIRKDNQLYNEMWKSSHPTIFLFDSNIDDTAAWGSIFDFLAPSKTQ